MEQQLKLCCSDVPVIYKKNTTIINFHSDESSLGTDDKSIKSHDDDRKKYTLSFEWLLPDYTHEWTIRLTSDADEFQVDFNLCMLTIDDLLVNLGKFILTKWFNKSIRETVWSINYCPIYTPNASPIGESNRYEYKNVTEYCTDTSSERKKIDVTSIVDMKSKTVTYKLNGQEILTRQLCPFTKNLNSIRPEIINADKKVSISLLKYTKKITKITL